MPLMHGIFLPTGPLSRSCSAPRKQFIYSHLVVLLRGNLRFTVRTVCSRSIGRPTRRRCMPPTSPTRRGITASCSERKITTAVAGLWHDTAIQRALLWWSIGALGSPFAGRPSPRPPALANECKHVDAAELLTRASLSSRRANRCDDSARMPCRRTDNQSHVRRSDWNGN